MQHRHVFAAVGQTPVSEAVLAVIGIKAGDHLLLHPLLLQPQGHHRIHPLQGPIQLALNRNPSPLGHRIHGLARRRPVHKGGEGLGQQRGGTAEHHVSPTGR